MDPRAHKATLLLEWHPCDDDTWVIPHSTASAACYWHTHAKSSVQRVWVEQLIIHQQLPLRWVAFAAA
jgi:hypothetical protein